MEADDVTSASLLGWNSSSGRVDVRVGLTVAE